MPRVAFTTLGCKVNQFETDSMEGLFRQHGYQIVGFEDESDVYVINTCSVTHLGEKKSRQLIRRAIRQNHAAIVAAVGCYSQTSPEQVAAIEGVSVIIGTQERSRIVELVEAAAQQSGKISAVRDVMHSDVFEDIPLFSAPGRTRAFLKVQEGCTNFCSYCIIPYARGPLRSRPLDSVRREVKKLVAAGFQEIVFTGIHLGSYGRDMEGAVTLADALKAALEEPQLQRLRLSSLESVEVSPEIIELMQEDKRFCSHLHLPLQAGEDSVLQAMNRHYTTHEYDMLLESIRAKVPEIAISTDLIVGFPGESEEKFAAALDFIATLGFAKMHVFPYSRRNGTPAAEFSGQIEEAEKRSRAAKVQEIAEQMSRRYQESFIGKTLEILVEGHQDGVANGLSGNYLRVYFASQQEVLRKMCRVRLEKAHLDGLWGEML